MSGFKQTGDRSLQVLYRLIGANMNVTTDQAFEKLHDFPAWVLNNIHVANASAAMTAAVGGVYTGAAKTGTILVAASQTWNSGDGFVLGLAVRPRLTVPPILSLSTPEGVARTCDLYVLGFGVL